MLSSPDLCYFPQVAPASASCQEIVIGHGATPDFHLLQSSILIPKRDNPHALLRKPRRTQRNCHLELHPSLASEDTLACKWDLEFKIEARSKEERVDMQLPSDKG